MRKEFLRHDNKHIFFFRVKREPTCESPNNLTVVLPYFADTWMTVEIRNVPARRLKDYTFPDNVIVIYWDYVINIKTVLDTGIIIHSSI